EECERLGATELFVARIIVRTTGGIHTPCRRRFNTYNPQRRHMWQSRPNRYSFQFARPAAAPASSMDRQEELVNLVLQKRNGRPPGPAISCGLWRNFGASTGLSSLYGICRSIQIN